MHDGVRQAYFADHNNLAGGGVQIMDTTTYVLTGVFSISGRQPCGLFAKDGASDWLCTPVLQNNSATGIRKDGLQWTAVSPTASGRSRFGVRIGTDLRGLSVSGNVDVGATGAVAGYQPGVARSRRRGRSYRKTRARGAESSRHSGER